MAQGELARRPRCRSLQEPEPVGETVVDLDRAHRRHAGRRQLDPERQAVERLADLGHRVGGLRFPQAEVGSDGARPVDEEGHGVGGRSAVQRQRRHDDGRFAVDAQDLARRRQDGDASRCAQDRLDRRGRCREQVLAVVEHEEQLAASQCFGDGVNERDVALGRDAQHRGDRRRYRPRVGDGRQLDHPHAVGEFAGELGTDLDRERDLPTPPTPVRVTSELDRTISLTSAIAGSRPTSEVSCGGRLPGKSSTLRSTGKSTGSPSATSWWTDMRPCRPRSRCSPNGRRATRLRSSTSVASETST